MSDPYRSMGYYTGNQKGNGKKLRKFGKAVLAGVTLGLVAKSVKDAPARKKQKEYEEKSRAINNDPNLDLFEKDEKLTALKKQYEKYLPKPKSTYGKDLTTSEKLAIKANLSKADADALIKRENARAKREREEAQSGNGKCIF